MEQLPLSMFCFYQLGLCSVSYAANGCSIYQFRIMIKDFSISFSRVIIVQDFETNFLCVIYIQADLLCYFLLNEKAARFKSVQYNLFILYIFTPKPFSLVRGYIEVKINKHEIW